MLACTARTDVYAPDLESVDTASMYRALSDDDSVLHSLRTLLHSGFGVHLPPHAVPLQVGVPVKPELQAHEPAAL